MASGIALMTKLNVKGEKLEPTITIKYDSRPELRKICAKISRFEGPNQLPLQNPYEKDDLGYLIRSEKRDKKTGQIIYGDYKKRKSIPKPDFSFVVDNCVLTYTRDDVDEYYYCVELLDNCLENEDIEMIGMHGEVFYN